MNLQPMLENSTIQLVALHESDFEALYAAASDPKIWEQHPNRDRWKKEAFQVYLEGAIQSKGAFKIINKTTGEIIGSTRFYDYDNTANSILIGYTFYATKYWGTGTNRAVKTLMLNYAFQFVDVVYFHIGSHNLRSQTAITRLSASKIGEQEISYFGEDSKLNYIYQICKTDWNAIIA
jgi:N-acetyltransferase